MKDQKDIQQEREPEKSGTDPGRFGIPDEAATSILEELGVAELLEKERAKEREAARQ